MTNREKLNQMSDDEFADWLCDQLWWEDYRKDKNALINVTRFHVVRNFLKMEAKENENQ